jgi:hypothetical protein
MDFTNWLNCLETGCPLPQTLRVEARFVGVVRQSASNQCNAGFSGLLHAILIPPSEWTARPKTTGHTNRSGKWNEGRRVDARRSIKGACPRRERRDEICL